MMDTSDSEADEPVGTGLASNPFLSSLPEHTQLLIKLSREASGSLDGEAIMSGALAAHCFARCFDDDLAESDAHNRLALAIRAVQSSAGLKRDIAELQRKADSDMGMKRVGAKIMVIQTDEEQVERRQRLVWDQRDS